MNHEMKEQAAFIAASMIALADMSVTELRIMTEIVGIDAIRELLAMDSLRFDRSYEEMAEEICAYIGWEPTLHPLYFDHISLDKSGRKVVDYMCALSVEGTEADLLFYALCAEKWI